MSHVVVASSSLTHAVEVKRRARANPTSAWPRPRSDRPTDLMEGELARPVITPSFSVSPGERVFTLGSCFTRAMEDALVAAGFDVPAARFSVPETERSAPRANSPLNQYVPPVMHQELRRAADGEDGASCLVEVGGDQWVDMQLFASLPVTRQRALERRREVSDLFERAYDSQIAIVTLGQVEAWWDALTEQFCNQMPTGAVLDAHPGRFFFRRLGVDEVATCVSDVCELLNRRGSVDRIVLTVSPVPISRAWGDDDALTSYVHSKSILRVAAQEVVEATSFVDYFPSYDIVALTDRSVAFAPDRMHIREAVVAEIVDRMLDAYVR